MFKIFCWKLKMFKSTHHQEIMACRCDFITFYFEYQIDKIKLIISKLIWFHCYDCYLSESLSNYFIMHYLITKTHIFARVRCKTELVAGVNFFSYLKIIVLDIFIIYLPLFSDGTTKSIGCGFKKKCRHFIRTSNC